jgi:hypothetical protein
VNIPDENVPYVLAAVEHYAAYMKATARDERVYLEIAESLKKKRQGKAEPEPRAAKKKRA